MQMVVRKTIVVGRKIRVEDKETLNDHALL